VLVYITGETQGTLQCRWLDLAKINLIAQDKVLDTLQRVFVISDRRRHWYFGETLGPEQLWTVD
jgi:hypothetical protein